MGSEALALLLPELTQVNHARSTRKNRFVKKKVRNALGRSCYAIHTYAGAIHPRQLHSTLDHDTACTRESWRHMPIVLIWVKAEPYFPIVPLFIRSEFTSSPIVAPPDADFSPQYVVAIDLGTSRTAYAWKSAADSTPFVGVPDSRDGDPTAKSPTAVLLNGSRDPQTKKFTEEEIVAFGGAAEMLFAQQRFPQAQIFKHFKMVSVNDTIYSLMHEVGSPGRA